MERNLQIFTWVYNFLYKKILISFLQNCLEMTGEIMKCFSFQYPKEIICCHRKNKSIVENIKNFVFMEIRENTFQSSLNYSEKSLKLPCLSILILVLYLCHFMSFAKWIIFMQKQKMTSCAREIKVVMPFYFKLWA